MRRKPELMQLEMGMSTRRYLPARGTAGFARSLVSGNSRVPCPPPMMTESTLLVLADCRPVCDMELCVERNRKNVNREMSASLKGFTPFCCAKRFVETVVQGL